MFVPASEPYRSRQDTRNKRSWSRPHAMEVVSINEFENHQLRYQDRIMDSAVDQLEALTRPNGEAQKASAEMVVQFGNLKVDDDMPPRLFEFDAPTTCRKWPGLRFASFCLHTQIPKHSSKTKSSKKSSEKKHGRLEDLKHGSRPRTATTHKPKNSHPTVLAPTISSPIASRNPPLCLMDLPAEVRNEIWTLLTVQKDPIEAQLRPIQSGKRGKITIRRFPQEPLLASVNKQLRREVLSLFYGTNKFVFEKSAYSVLKDLNMTEIATMKTWKPRKDVAGFLTHIDILFELSFGMSVAYGIHLNDTALTIDVKARYNKKKGSLQRSVCLCGEQAIAKYVKTTCQARGSDRDLMEVAVELVDRRTSHPAPMPSWTCSTCGQGR